jgi:hypothetical protein
VLTDLNKAPHGSWRRRDREGDSHAYWEISYEFHVENSLAGLLKYSLMADGVECGSVESIYYILYTIYYRLCRVKFYKAVYY